MLSRDRSRGSGPGVGYYFSRVKKPVESSTAGLIGANGRSKAWCRSIPKSLGSLVVSPMSDKNNMCIIVLKDRTDKMRMGVLPSRRTVLQLRLPFEFFLLGGMEDGKGRETGNICLLLCTDTTGYAYNKIGGSCKHRLTGSSRLMHAKARSDQSAVRVMP